MWSSESVVCLAQTKYMPDPNSKFSFQKLLFGNKSLCEGKLASVALRVTDTAGRVTGLNKFCGFWFHEGSSIFKKINTDIWNYSSEGQTNLPP